MEINLNRIKAERIAAGILSWINKSDVEILQTPKPTPAPTPKPANGYTDSLGVFWRYQTGEFTLTEPLHLRWGATVKSSALGIIPTGSVIKYDAYAYSGGYVWIRQPRGHNTYAYMATGNANGNTRTSYFGKFK